MSTRRRTWRKPDAARELVSFRIRREDKEALERFAASMGYSVSEVVKQALRSAGFVIG